MLYISVRMRYVNVSCPLPLSSLYLLFISRRYVFFFFRYNNTPFYIIHSSHQGTIAEISCSSIYHPFEVVKTRMQLGVHVPRRWVRVTFSSTCQKNILTPTLEHRYVLRYPREIISTYVGICCIENFLYESQTRQTPSQNNRYLTLSTQS